LGNEDEAVLCQKVTVNVAYQWRWTEISNALYDGWISRSDTSTDIASMWGGSDDVGRSVSLSCHTVNLCCVSMSLLVLFICTVVRLPPFRLIWLRSIPCCGVDVAVFELDVWLVVISLPVIACLPFGSRKLATKQALWYSLVQEMWLLHWNSIVLISFKFHYIAPSHTLSCHLIWSIWHKWHKWNSFNLFICQQYKERL